MNQDLKIIKKKYGEKMMHFCRKNFSDILETEGLLSKLLLDHFDPTHLLYDYLVKTRMTNDFIGYINSFTNSKKLELVDTGKTPMELMKEAGYTLYECKTKEDIQKFRKYYAKDEELCTFRGNRLNKCFVFFAVKKDVDSIQRKNFKNPERQDEYGTSVISIQFTRDVANILSIKNRYNHTVDSCDSTFSNNLENIIPGLTKSFEKEYGLIQKYQSNSQLTDLLALGNDGKFYMYTYECNGIYYGIDNVIVDHGVVKKYDKERYIVTPDFILDLKEKKMFPYDPNRGDSFADSIKDIDKIFVTSTDENKYVSIVPKIGEPILIALNKKNQMTKISDPNIEVLEDNYLYYSYDIKDIYLPKVKKIGDDCFYYNRGVKKIELENVEEVGDYFFRYNQLMEQISMAKVRKFGKGCFQTNENVKVIAFENVEEVGHYFFEMNIDAEKIEMPKVHNFGNGCFFYNRGVKEIEFENVEEIGDYFFNHNQIAQKN